MESFLIVSTIALWIGFIALALICFALTRQIGVLYERVAPAGALAMNQNLTVGQDAPELSLRTLDSKLVTVGGQPADGKSKLLFFVSPDCPVCKSLLPVLKSAASAEESWINVTLCSDGQQQDHPGFVKTYGLDSFPYVVSELLGKTYGVAKLPYAVLVDEQGKIASMGIINSREHLDSLFEAKEHNVASIQEYMKKKSGQQESPFKEVK